MNPNNRGQQRMNEMVAKVLRFSPKGPEEPTTAREQARLSGSWATARRKLII